MNISRIKFIDKYLGTILCVILGFFTKRKHIETTELQSIGFIQLWGIGESITTLPTIKAAKEKFPKAKITVFCTTRVKSVFDDQPFVDNIEIISLNPFSILGYLFTYRRTYDLVIDFEEYLNISSLIAFSLGKQRIGYGNQKRSKLYHWKIPYNDRQHVAQTHMDLLQGIGIKKTVQGLEPVTVSPESKKAVEHILHAKGMYQHKLIGIAPGAAESSKSRMWPLTRFASLAQWILEHYDAPLALIGNAQEKKICEELITLITEDQRKKIINLAGTTNIQEAYALIQRLDLLVSNDSGPMHIGACLGVKTIGLFGPNLPKRFEGLGKHSINIYKGESCKYSPCINVHKGQVPECLWGKQHKNYIMCMKNIEAKDVELAVVQLMPFEKKKA